VLSATRRPEEFVAGVHRLAAGRGALAVNVYFVRAGDGWVLIDAGWASHAPTIRVAAESLFGRDRPPAAIVLTHIHPDHSGAAPDLARMWQVPVKVHPDEMPLAPGGYRPEYAHPLDRWIVAPIMRLMPRRRLQRLQRDRSLEGVASLGISTQVWRNFPIGGAFTVQVTHRATPSSFAHPTVC
jgi:glyoxylase-like metal-dependent hydrolase (beta-lactamase superfamily II)